VFKAKPDPKDEVIAWLKEENAALNLRNAKLVEQVIALSNTSAYRALNPREPLAEAKPAEVVDRRTPFDASRLYEDANAKMTVATMRPKVG
jgi:hypothetical protein